MKKLKKFSFQEIRAQMQQIGNRESEALKGGMIISSFPINGGKIVNYSSEVFGNYAVYYPDNGGSPIAMDGVNVSGGTFGQASDAAYQMNGEIHVGSGFDTFDVNTLAHEYGHYLQQESMGDSSYMFGVAIPSVYSVLTNPEDHSSQPFEVDATNRGEEYFFGSH